MYFLMFHYYDYYLHLSLSLRQKKKLMVVRSCTTFTGGATSSFMQTHFWLYTAEFCLQLLLSYSSQKGRESDLNIFKNLIQVNKIVLFFGTKSNI